MLVVWNRQVSYTGRL